MKLVQVLFGRNYNLVRLPVLATGAILNRQNRSVSCLLPSLISNGLKNRCPSGKPCLGLPPNVWHREKIVW
jgi:hypothetical protein